MKRYLASIALAAVLSTPSLAPAQTMEERCRGDSIATHDLADGRNHWARRCGYINDTELEAARMTGMYWTMTPYHGFPLMAPVRVEDGCEGYKKFGMCPVGCFAAGERLLFGGVYMMPEAAFLAKVTMTSLGPDATPGSLSLAEQEVSYFIRGEEKGHIVRIQTHDGRRLAVTPNHPMVEASGLIVPAAELAVGMELLMIDGTATVASLQTVDYEGLVWNVRPVSDEPRANINIAEGFLTGSARFQNDWASEAGRLLLRQTISTDAP